MLTLSSTAAAKVDDQMVFSHKIDTEGTPVANQLASGRWYVVSLPQLVQPAESDRR